MNIEELRNYCLSLEDTSEKTPFGKFARRYESILVFYTVGHMYCMVDMDDFSYVSVRSTPDEIDELRMSHSSVSRPLNPSLRYWIELKLGGDISDKDIYRLIRRAYDIVNAKYTRKQTGTPHDSNQ